MLSSDDRQTLKTLYRERVADTREVRAATRIRIAQGRAAEAEPDRERAQRFLARMSAVLAPLPRGAERVQGDTVDFVDPVFLLIGHRVSRTVANIVMDEGHTSIGTGFMVSPSLLLTNNHVIGSEADARAAWAKFNFERDEGFEREPCFFELRPDLFFRTVDWRSLDYTLVAVGDLRFGQGALANFGHCPISDRPDRHIIGAHVNVIQHPGGGFKKLVLRENRIVSRLDLVLHYEADTEEGSSGGAVFNDAWEPVALHHWAEPFLETKTVEGVEVPITVNEGIRISAIVRDLRSWREGLAADSKQVQLLDAALNKAEVPTPVVKDRAVMREGRESNMSQTTPLIGAGSFTEAKLTIPLEVTVRIGEASPQLPASASTSPVAAATPPGAERVRIDRNYSNRRGYDGKFLPSLPLPLAGLVSDEIRPLICPVERLRDGLIEGELAYQHFSVLMHRERKLAILTATNIDGATYVTINRKTGLPDEAEGETWYPDPRIQPETTIQQRFYSATSIYFDRGHLTRRTDPTWGTNERAIRANADTYHFTNCTPQHWLFNQSVDYWQGIERHYLEYGATLDKSRLTVLQGCIFTEDDPSYDDLEGNSVLVPLNFWKIVVRVENDIPRATGLIAGHAPLLERKRAGSGMSEVEEEPDVSQFLASIERIERDTRLNLTALRAADTFEATGAESGLRRIQGWSDFG